MAEYGGLVTATLLLAFVRATCTFVALVRGSQALHDRMLRRVLRAPVSFFDTNPLGRVVNRFAKDVGNTDDVLPMTVFDFSQCILMVVGIVALSVVVNPWVALSLLPLAWYFLRLRRFFLKTSREVKRLEAVSRSPVLARLSETLDGLATLRAFRGAEGRFRAAFHARVDRNTRAYFCFIATARWFGFRLDAICTAFLAAAALLSVMLAETRALEAYGVDGALLGLSIMYCVQPVERKLRRCMHHLQMSGDDKMTIDTERSSLRQLWPPHD